MPEAAVLYMPTVYKCPTAYNNHVYKGVVIQNICHHDHLVLGNYIVDMSVMYAAFIFSKVLWKSFNLRAI